MEPAYFYRISAIFNKVFQLYNRTMQRKSNFLFRKILQTPPVKINKNCETILYSALNRVNCRAYILAAKSFLRFYPNVAVVVQNDGDLDKRSIKELRKHLNGITIFPKESMFKIIKKNFSNDIKCLIPKENDYYAKTSVRILYLKCFNVIARFKNRKILFMDSDMIFLKPHKLIEMWIKQPYKYDIYGEGGSYLAEIFHKIGFKYKNIDVSNFNSGFLGVGGEIKEAKLAMVLKKIQDYNPKLFYEWEIEQSVWATLITEREKPVNLDEQEDVFIGSGWRTYSDLKKNAIIAHFVGAIRFKNFRYLRLAHQIIKELQSK